MALVLLVTVICYLCVVFILVSKDIRCFVLSELQLHLIGWLIWLTCIIMYKLHVLNSIIKLQYYYYIAATPSMTL